MQAFGLQTRSPLLYGLVFTLFFSLLNVTQRYKSGCLVKKFPILGVIFPIPVESVPTKASCGMITTIIVHMFPLRRVC